MSLYDLFMARHAEIQARLSGWAPDFSALDHLTQQRIDLSAPAGAMLQQALALPDRNFTSWMPGLPLPALLVAGRRITVDIAPEFLAFGLRHYQLSIRALADFGRAGMLLFNLRNFDPTASEEQRRREAAAYEPWEGLIRLLFDRAGSATYFLGALRAPLFDAIPEFRGKHTGPKPSLGTIAKEAGKDLATVAQMARELPPGVEQATRAIFRSEETKPIATAWHWAYVQSVGRFVDPELATRLSTEYATFKSAGEDQSLSAEAREELGKRYVLFQIRMRFAHLVYSAPLSASFGGPYGYSLEDDQVFMAAVQTEAKWYEVSAFEYDFFADDLLDVIQDLQVGRLRSRFAVLMNGRTLELMRGLGADLFVRTEPEPYYEHYEDAANRAELIDYWLSQAPLQSSYAAMRQRIDGLLSRPGGLDPRDLHELAAMRQQARQATDAALRKFTQGYQIVTGVPPGYRPTPATMTALNPQEASLWLRALQFCGLVSSNPGLVGAAGDHQRVAYSAGRNFRDKAR